MLVIGLTGGIGSGKSTIASIFSDFGIEVVNADQIAREVVEPGSEALAAIADHFGNDILLVDGSLDRNSLRRIVFADAEERLWLEQLTHPLIAKLIKQRILSSSAPYTILESPLLLETSQKDFVDRVLVVDIDEATQLERTLARDGGKEETIQAIIDSQLPRAKRLEGADDVVDNSADVAAVRERINQLHTKYLNLAATA